MKKIYALILCVSLFLFLIPIVAAQGTEPSSDEDILIFGHFELEEVLNFGSAILALFLFTLTALAYKRNKNKRLVYVSVAFLLYTIHGFISSSQLFFGEYSWIDPIASLLNFAILICFFLGIIRK